MPYVVDEILRSAGMVEKFYADKPEALARRERALICDLIACAIVWSANDIPDPRRIKTLFREDPS